MEQRKDIEIRKAHSKFMKEARIKECFYDERNYCSSNIISAHSLQKNGVLSILEEDVNGNKAVYSFLDKMYDNNGLPISLKPIGKSDASAFLGFCSYHDKLLFKAIEDQPINLEKDEHCFLLSYRAFAKDYHAKYETVKGYKVNATIRDSFNKGIIDNLISASELGLRDFNIARNRFNQILKARDYSDLEYLTYKIDHVIPIASAGSFTPMYSYRNEVLNNSMSSNDYYQYVNFVIQPTNNNETIILLSCFPEHEKSVKYLDQLDGLKELPFLRAITSIAIANVENTFISPSIWNTMTIAEKRQTMYELHMTTPVFGALQKGFFHSKLNFFQDRFRKNAT